MLPLVVSVNSSEELEESLPFRRIRLNADNIPLDQLMILLQSYPQSEFFIYFSSSSVDEVLGALNAGALGAVVTPELFEDLLEAGAPRNRLGVQCANAKIAKELISAGQLAGVTIPFTSTENLKELYDYSQSLVQTHGSFVPIYVEDAEKVYKQIGNYGVPIINSSSLTIDPKSNPNKIAVADVIISQLHSDRPDGLYLTVVTDRYNKLLGTVFSSKESIAESLRTGTGVYQSRKRGLWYKGASSGATQELLGIHIDCDGDALQFSVEQKDPGFCHHNTYSCFGPLKGITRLERTIKERKLNAPKGSYTNRLFNDSKLLNSKLMEEAEELCDANSKSEIAWEAADLLYFLSVKLAQNDVSLADVEANLEAKSLKITRRTGDAKPKWAAVTEKKANTAAAAGAAAASGTAAADAATNNAAAKAPTAVAAPASTDPNAPIKMHLVPGNSDAVSAALRRPAQSSNAFELARPIVNQVREKGDRALLELTEKFDKCKLASPVLNAPFPAELMHLDPEVKSAIDLACVNVEKFHAAQLTKDMSVETAPGVVCSRFARAIARVGLYVPGGSAVLPSTAIMLGVPAMVAGCSDIIFASPPRPDGTITPEVVYVAHKVGAKQIVLAGGAQAVAALAYGTSSVTKCDKILGPGNQFVTAAKMIVQTDLDAQVSIDMPAGPSEVLVVADRAANKAFVVSDLLSQAEHGPDSQVILIAIDWTPQDIELMQAELDKQARALPRFEVIRKSIAHSTIITVPNRAEAIRLSNLYAPEHLILQVENARELVQYVTNAGSVFVGALSPESCGDYTSGTNHTLPTYGYANQYSGVNTSTFLKHITSQELTPEGMRNIGPATVALARREGLDAHANAVVVRLAELNKEV